MDSVTYVSLLNDMWVKLKMKKTRYFSAHKVIASLALSIPAIVNRSPNLAFHS
jgi:hypothetical protein